MTVLTRLASDRQERIVSVSETASREAVALWQRIPPTELEAGWDLVAPAMTDAVVSAQVDAAAGASRAGARVASALGGPRAQGTVVPQAFAGVSREGRQVAPELYAAVTTTKSLIRGGLSLAQAYAAGAAYVGVAAATLVRDAGRGADKVAAVAHGAAYSVRVVQPGACSRCAILAGVKGYRTDFQRHPGCRCSSMMLFDNQAPDGFFSNPFDYFESLSASEQDRVFTKAGAEAIRLGADPLKVVNARRGMYTTTRRRVEGSYSSARLRPVTIGRNRDGSPLQVYATTEGTTARSAWARAQGGLRRIGDERYRRTSTVRLMPESILHMAGANNPERARELLAKYGYLI